ncbi:hypothetical protein MMC08_000075 [Hypocenomyce scalaris]|nr:hypothetical protein [Hypocenomyce scalaris]
MAGQRTPQARTRPKPQLGDSWVVESDGDDEEGVIKSSPRTWLDSNNLAEADAGRQKKVFTNMANPSTDESPRKRSSRTSTRASVEPELRMPSIHENSMDGSWVDGRGLHRASRRTPKQERTSTPNDEDSIIPAAQQRVEKKSEQFQTPLRPVFGWIADVLGRALDASKTPISYIIAIYLLFGLMLLLRNLLTTSIYSALSPICRVPGASLLNLPMCHSQISSNYKGAEVPPVEFDQLMTVQSKFEEVLEASARGVSLPLDMKRGEISIRDLRQVVRFSQLQSKNELVLEFDGFVEAARIASYDLQKFNSHVGRGVDNILATAGWTQRVLDGIALRDGSRGAIQSFFSDKFLAPFQPLKFTEETLLDQYIQHTRIVEEEIRRLIDEAQALLLVLQNLEDRLDVIHGIAVRDNLHIQGSKDEVLLQLWTMLGGNRNKLGKFDSQLKLLRQVNEYRQSAFAHVSGTMLKLQAMGAELEELRERVGSPELLRDRAHIPLSVHIENIQLGVERLELGRRNAKKLEDEHLTRTLHRNPGDKNLIEGG